MSLVYRAIWQDDRDELCAHALTDMRTWISEKCHDQIDVPETGYVAATIREGASDCSVDIMVEQAGAHDASITALRTAMAEVRSDGVRWKITLRVWQEPATGTGFVWTDLSAVGDNPNLRTLAPAAPRLVRKMLSTATNPRVGSQPSWSADRSERDAAPTGIGNRERSVSATESRVLRTTARRCTQRRPRTRRDCRNSLHRGQPNRRGPQSGRSPDGRGPRPPCTPRSQPAATGIATGDGAATGDRSEAVARSRPRRS